MRRAGAGAASPGALFTDTERRRLGHALAASIGTAHLLGAARIRRRADQATRHHADPQRDRGAPARRFSDVPTDLRCFDETAGGEGIEPMPPAAAVSYFQALVPGLDVDAQAFAATIGRQAFALAVTTDKTLLDKVWGIITDRRESGQVGGAADEVQAVLEAAGVAPANPQYSDMVVRTNLMEQYNVGAQRELAGMADVFPVWEYHNPSDSRSRPEHAARSGKYWPADRHFTDVRGTDPADACNCRCTFVPIDSRQWADLQAAGERTEDE